MGRQRMFKKGHVLEATIKGLAFGGKGVAKIPTENGDFTIFIQNTFPGQTVKAQVVLCKRRHAECRLMEVLENAPEEVGIPFQAIPGAPYATFPIEAQHKYKEETTLDLFRRIAGIEKPEELYKGLVPSPTVWHYRNKMEYSFSSILHDLESGEKVDGFGLGFKHRGTWWAVENLDRDSGLFDKQVENDLIKIRQWCEATGLPAWHPPQRKGFYRFFVVRRSLAENSLLINLVTTPGGEGQFDPDEFVAFIKELWGERVAGILHTINDDTGERVEARQGNSKLIYGRERITEELHGLKFDISLSSFFQTNPQSAEKLYGEVLSLALEEDLGGESDVVLDLFCGTGTISQLLAKEHSGKVIGVDIVESAIEDARISAERNGSENIQFYAADVGKFLLQYPEYRGNIRTLVMDPPRAGISPKTLRKVIRLQADRMVYVSCNPATQARDIAMLAENGYRLVQFKLVDQFSHTSHVESVALFERIEGFVTKIDLNR